MQIPVAHGHLEALYRTTDASVRGAAVMCHPHPLHGGTMRTKAVFRTSQALEEAGFHVLRFNFRGVGTSTGKYGEGVEEEEDVEAALAWLRAQHSELPLLVGGFSFGSRVGFRVGLRESRVKGLLGVGLPIELYDFSFLSGTRRPVLVVQGEEDEFGPGPDIQGVMEGLDAPITLVRVQGAGHFFHDRFEELKDAVREYFTGGPGSEAFPLR